MIELSRCVAHGRRTLSDTIADVIYDVPCWYTVGLLCLLGLAFCGARERCKRCGGFVAVSAVFDLWRGGGRMTSVNHGAGRLIYALVHVRTTRRPDWSSIDVSLTSRTDGELDSVLGGHRRDRRSVDTG